MCVHIVGAHACVNLSDLQYSQIKIHDDPVRSLCLQSPDGKNGSVESYLTGPSSYLTQLARLCVLS